MDWFLYAIDTSFMKELDMTMSNVMKVVIVNYNVMKVVIKLVILNTLGKITLPKLRPKTVYLGNKIGH